MTTRRRTLVIAGLIAVLARASDASAPPQAQTFRASVDAQWIIATAIGKDGRLVTDLGPADFEVSDRGTAREITTFSNDPIPFALAVMLDTSGSMAANLSLERRGLSALTSQFKPGDRAAIGTFADAPAMSPHFSANPDTLASWVTSTIAGMGVPCRQPTPVPGPWRGEPQNGATVNLIQPTGGGTALWDALECAVMAVAADAETPRRVVLVITDGVDNASVATQQDIQDYANHFGVMIYCIAMMGDEGANAGELRALAAATGGGYFYLAPGDDIGPVFARVADELRHQYVFGLSPLGSDPNGRGIEVRARRPDVVVRARRVDFEATTENAVAPSAAPDARSVPSAPPAASPAPAAAAQPPSPPPSKPSGPPRSPATSAVIPGFASVLDSYLAQPRPVSIDTSGLGSMLVSLKATAPAWAMAAGAVEAPRRRLAVATLVLDALLPHGESELWITGGAAEQLLEWACEFLRRNPSPVTDVHGAERLWDIASIGILERLGGSSRSPLAGFTTYDRPSGPAVPDVLGYHIFHAESRFPKEPRWPIALGIASELYTWPEWRDYAPFNVEPRLMADVNGAYEKATFVPGARSEAFVRWGAFELRRGLPAKALEHFKLAGRPGDPVVAYWLDFLSGQAHHALNQDKEEMAAYRAALVDVPFAQSASVALGAALLVDHRDAEAAALVSRSLDHQVEDPFQLFAFPDWRYVEPALAALRREVVR